VIAAVASNADDEVLASAMRGAGFKSKNDNSKYLASFGRLMFGSIKPEYMEREYHIKLREIDQLTKFPSSLVMITRVAALLRGLGLVFRHNLDVSRHWDEFAQSALVSQGHVN
jgi:hypothetical protein